MIAPIVVAVVVALLTYTYTKLRYTRLQKWAHLPQLPPSLLWGHLRVFDEYAKRQKPGAYADVAFDAMHKDLGRPPIMVMDTRPVVTPVLVIAHHDVAEQIVKSSAVFPFSAPKAPDYHGKLYYITGKHSILVKEGEEWKRLRRRFNPGFAPQYLGTFVPEVLEKGVQFLQNLETRVQSQETFSLMALTMRLTFDVIGKVVLEIDLGAQADDKDRRGETIRVYEDLLDLYGNDVLSLPWWLTPVKVFRRARVARRLHALLKDIVRQKHAELRGNESASIGGKPPRSVLSLSLQDVDTLTQEVIDETADQLRTFLFAGHDTTSTLLSWVFYELSRTPHVLKALRDELDNLFGPDEKSPTAIRDQLLRNQDKLQNMPYTTALIKETLRFHPPAGSGRMIPSGSAMMLRLPGGEGVCADGFQIYLSQPLIQFDKEVYGDTADQFLPERWLGKEGQKFPPGAWRPFERGPRNCIGQELVYIEARVIIAMVARRYQFVKVGLGEVLLDGKTGLPTLDPAKDGKQYKVVEELYPILMWFDVPDENVTAKPVDDMQVKVRIAGQ